MNARGLIGAGLLAGLGLGQTAAGLFLPETCTNPPGMTALSTVGPGMLALGGFSILRALRRARSI